MNKETFNDLLNNINLTCSDEQYKKLCDYLEFLKEYNSHTNLTSITEDKEVFIKHFYDSLTICKVIDLNKVKSLLDIGTGAGFPGVVLKLFFPNINVTLVDSNNKKISFLNELIVKLNLKGIETKCIRAEELVKERINYYDVVTARAVANLRVLSEISIPLVKKDGVFIAMKANAEEEINNAVSTIDKMNSKIDHVEEFALPYNNDVRTLIKVTKNMNSSLNKLRPYSQIIKSELK